MRRFASASVLTLVLAVSSHAIVADDFEQLSTILSRHCLDCHDAETRTGGIDLATLLQQQPDTEEARRLWIRVEQVVSDGEMPPPEQPRPAAAEIAAVNDWFWNTYVLRDGKPHIGTTPLRRLTRYELQNTLEDALAISLSPPYRNTLTGQLDQSEFMKLIPSDLPGESGFDNDAQRLESLRPPLQQIAEAVHLALDQFSRTPAAVQTVLGVPEIPLQADELESRETIIAFLRRTMRSDPADLPHQTQVWHSLYLDHVATSQDSRRSLMHIFEMILVSPDVLYRIESTQQQATPYPVTGVELASRLSYFLWSSAPDAELLQHGQDSSLLQDDVLLAQTDRMLNSPRRLSLAENFAGQWLGFNDLLTSEEYFRDELWNRESYDEVLFFFDELIRADRSLFDLVQSEWAYLRDTAASAAERQITPISRESTPGKYADLLSTRPLPGKRDPQNYYPPLLVQATADEAGGIITTPAIMRVTAAKDRTSPVRRGVWLLNTLIGKRLEPPADVPPLEEARVALAVKQNPTVAELLQQHVSRAECISCHQAIDPLGLGLENYDSFGEWRERYPDAVPVVASGVMPDGSRFSSPRELKTLLQRVYQQEIAENFVHQLYAYALGRALQPHDRVSLQQIIAAVAAEDYRVTSVIRQIVLSDQFRMRQDAEDP